MEHTEVKSCLLLDFLSAVLNDEVFSLVGR